MRQRGRDAQERATSATPIALLLGKLRDDTEDIVTPSHTKKGDQRHQVVTGPDVLMSSATAEVMDGLVGEIDAAGMRPPPPFSHPARSPMDGCS